jgi:type II secretory pathway pseudopilin PulG
MSTPRPPGEKGFSLVEIAFGLVIFAIAAVVLINHLSVNYSATRLQTDRVFAFTKAQSLLAEVQAYVDRGDAAAAIDLDVLDDGVTEKWPLTISKEGGNLVAADHPLSGNVLRDSQWVWSRRITVRPFLGLNNRNVRYVTVRVSRHDTNGNAHQLAEISSVVHSVGSAFPTTQVFDLYLLAIENIPGWWVYMESIRPFFESTLADLQSRNPGLEVRTHWITKAGYGRNQWYSPLINEANASTSSIANVYYYPGLMPTGSASSYYYVPGAMSARMSYDGTQQHGYDADTNPYPYALADWFNHTMRYPQERALHDKRVAAAAARRVAVETARRNSTPLPAAMDDPSEEPTLRLLLEDMCTDPNKYRRALLVNLHGELLPMPSLRNYSDAAKDPENLPEVRVVTHPEELRTQRTATAIDDVHLRVYAYVTSPDHFTGSTVMPDSRPIALKIKNVDLSNGFGGLIPGVEIRRLAGGVAVGGDNRYYGFASTTTGRLGIAPTKQTAVYANEMCYTVQYVDPGSGQEKYTLIKLYRTPVVAPAVAGKGVGTSTRSRLYGLEYIPSCCEAAGDFSRDLSYSADVPKNTARWRIKVPGTVFGQNRFVSPSGTYHNPSANVVLTVQTSIWDESRDAAGEPDVRAGLADAHRPCAVPSGQPVRDLHVVGRQRVGRADDRALPVPGRPAAQPVSRQPRERDDARLPRRLQLELRRPERHEPHRRVRLPGAQRGGPPQPLARAPPAGPAALLPAAAHGPWSTAARSTRR